MTKEQAKHEHLRGESETLLGELCKERYLEVPEGGWKPHTLYEVKVAWSRNNPVYTCLMYSGFLAAHQPAGYSCLWSPTAHEAPNWKDLWYLEIVRDLGVDFIALVQPEVKP